MRAISERISGPLAGGMGTLLAAILVALLFALTADSALACTVCTGGQEEASRKAFVATTALLTFLPMVVVGTAVFFFVRRTRAQEQRDAQERPDAARTETRSVA
jgi:heme/copper-type cytochrome/quinol oxidase subunit 2